jgi:hypothetical protein
MDDREMRIRLRPNRGGHSIQYLLSCGHKTEKMPLIKYPESLVARDVAIASSYECRMCGGITRTVVNYDVITEPIDPKTETKEEREEFEMMMMRLEQRLQDRRWDFFMMVIGVVLGSQLSLGMTMIVLVYNLSPVMILVMNVMVLAGILIVAWKAMGRFVFPV